MREIKYLTLIGGWAFGLIVIFLIDEFFLDMEVPFRLYLFLIAIFVVTVWLIRDTRKYQQRIRQLHENIRSNDLEIDGIKNLIKELTTKYPQLALPEEAEDYDPVVLFNRLDPSFIPSLRKLVPNITEGEERLCVLIRLNKRNKEIAQILDIDENSVYTARARLKRKLPLAKGDTLDKWIRNVEQSLSNTKQTDESIQKT